MRSAKLGNHLKERERHAFWWITEFVFVELFKVKKYGNTSEV